jgi:hypothetical protein
MALARDWRMTDQIGARIVGENRRGSTSNKGAAVNTVTSYRQIAANLDRSLATVARRPEVARESAYYLAHIREVKSADEFIKNGRLFSFAMKAFGLKDMIYGKAFMRKVLNEGIDGKSSFALQLADPRFKEFAEAFNFARYGVTATAFTRAQQGTVDSYVRVELETEAGITDEGVRLALYFQRKAPEITSVFGLMGDAALYKVVQTALGLPAALSNVDIDTQAAIIGAKLDVDKLKDGTGLDKFITKFAARWQAAAGTAGLTAPQIGLSQPALTTLPNSAMLMLQTLRNRR